MKKIIAVIGLVAVMTLTGCTADNADEPRTDGTWYATEIKLPDGSYVTCVAVGSSGAGLSCDWENRE